MRRRTAVFAAALASAAGLATSSAMAQVTITPVLMEGEFLDPVGAITSIANLAVNDGGEWLAEVDTDNPDTEADGALVKNGVLFLREGQVLGTSGRLLDSFGAVNLSNAGDFAGNIFLDGPISNDSGLFFNADRIFEETHISTAAGFSAGTVYTGFFDGHLNNNNQLLFVVSVDDPALAGTTNRALVRIDYTPGTGAFTETVLAKQDDTIPGMVGPLTEIETSPYEIDFNDAGEYIFIPNAGTVEHIFLGTTLLAVEGGDSPVAGRPWLSLGTSAVGINNTAQYVYTGQLSGDTATDLVIVRNGQVFRQEGDPVPGMPQFALQSFGTSRIVDIADDGSVLWYGDWNDPDTTRDSGLFVGDQLLVQEGVTQVATSQGTLTVLSVGSVQDTYAISDDGRYVLAEVVLQGATTLDTLLLIDLGAGSACYANCDDSTTAPVLNVADFTCFLQRFAAGESYANCDGSTTPPVLNVADFTCFLQSFAAGCP